MLYKVNCARNLNWIESHDVNDHRRRLQVRILSGTPDLRIPMRGNIILKFGLMGIDKISPMPTIHLKSLRRILKLLVGPVWYLRTRRGSLMPSLYTRYPKV